MQATELIFAPGASDHVKKAAQSLPAYDLLKAYRDARTQFNTNDIVLAVVVGDPETFIAMPRAAYVDQAFRRWNEKQKQMHPLAKDKAHGSLKVPFDTPAWWLVLEYPDKGMIECCAIAAVHYAVDDDGDVELN